MSNTTENEGTVEIKTTTKEDHPEKKYGTHIKEKNNETKSI